MQLSVPERADSIVPLILLLEICGRERNESFQMQGTSFGPVLMRFLGQQTKKRKV
jgi:hypothetical protein